MDSGQEQGQIQVPVESMGRRERRNKLRFLKKELKKHNDSKPEIDVNETDPDALASRVDYLRGWGTRYAILKKKIDELETYSKRGS